LRKTRLTKQGKKEKAQKNKFHGAFSFFCQKERTLLTLPTRLFEYQEKHKKLKAQKAFIGVHHYGTFVQRHFFLSEKIPKILYFSYFPSIYLSLTFIFDPAFLLNLRSKLLLATSTIGF